MTVAALSSLLDWGVLQVKHLCVWRGVCVFDFPACDLSCRAPSRSWVWSVVRYWVFSFWGCFSQQQTNWWVNQFQFFEDKNVRMVSKHLCI